MHEDPEIVTLEIYPIIADPESVQGLAAAFQLAVEWMATYAGWATSGGEGVALSYKRDRFHASLVREFGYDPTKVSLFHTHQMMKVFPSVRHAKLDRSPPPPRRGRKLRHELERGELARNVPPAQRQRSNSSLTQQVGVPVRGHLHRDAPRSLSPR